MPGSGGVDNVLGKYRLIAELGRGGMAEVYLALVRGPADFSKLLVIKRLRPHLSEDGEFVQMFLDEARLAARLSHPNIVQTIEVGESSGHYYICMEYLEGQPLNRIFRRCRTALTEPMALRIIRDALHGLHHAHELKDFDGTPLNVVHRDVTPHNIFVTYNGVVKVVDFGIAKAANSVVETRAGVLKGKVSYMAPEQARGEATDRRADIFSIGCCLWEILAGQRLWKGKTDIQVLSQLLSDDCQIAPPSSLNPNVPPAVEAICMRALALDVGTRPQTALALRDELDSYLSSIGSSLEMTPVAEIISERFETEQRRLRELIRVQTQTATSMPSGEYARVAIPRLPQPPLAHLTPSGHDFETPISQLSQAGSGPRGVSHNGSHPSMRSVPPTHSALVAPASPRRWLPAAGAAAGLAATAVVIWILATPGPMPAASTSPTAPIDPAVPHSESADDTRGAAAASPSAAQWDSDAASKSIVLSVVTTPPDATILLDGKRMNENPLRLELPRDGEEHLLEIRADGFETITRKLSFDDDVKLDISLSKDHSDKPRFVSPRPPAPVAALPPSVPAPAPPPVPAAVPRLPPKQTTALGPAPKETRKLDGKNPYN